MEERVAMSITELAIHNVLRTYSRQDRLSKIQRPRATGGSAAADKLTLSPEAQKMASAGRVADETVSARFPALTGTGRDEMVQKQTQDILRTNGADVENKSVTPDAFEAKLRQTYLK